MLKLFLFAILFYSVITPASGEKDIYALKILSSGADSPLSKITADNVTLIEVVRVSPRADAGPSSPAKCLLYLWLPDSQEAHSSHRWDRLRRDSVTGKIWLWFTFFFFASESKWTLTLVFTSSAINKTINMHNNLIKLRRRYKIDTLI